MIGAPKAADASTSKPVNLAGAAGKTGWLVPLDAENVGRLAMDDTAGSKPNVPIPR